MKDRALHSELDHIAERLCPIFDQLRVGRATVFGSQARSEPLRRSNLDLIGVMNTDKPFLEQ